MDWSASRTPGVVYLDHAATTPMRPEAVAAMLPYLTEHFGNPSGAHRIARRARLALDEARERVAALLGADPCEVIFTSGGTEADNLAIVGTCARRGGIALCSAAEHHAVLHAVAAVGGRTVGVDADGAVDLVELEEALLEMRAAAAPGERAPRARAGGESAARGSAAGDAAPGEAVPVAVVSVMAVNNEVGTRNPLAEVAALLERVGAAPFPRGAGAGPLLHTDAVQAACFSDLATLAAPAQLVSVAAHKVGGPKGVGALVARRGAEPAPILHGGGQERDLRSGTHDVAGIVGFAAALAAAAAEREEAAARVVALRDRLVDGLLAAVPGAVESGRRERKGPAHAHVRFSGVEAEELLVLFDREGICASAGSSCASGATEPSHVLRAMGVPPAEAAGAVRFSLGWCSTEADVARALEVVPKAVAALGGGVRR